MPSAIQLDVAFVAGDTVSFPVVNADYPANAWTCSWIIASSVPFVQAATISGTQFQITIVPGTSATILPGKYANAFIFTKTATGERRTLAGSAIIVQPNPVNPITPGWAQATLTLVEASLTKLASRTNQQVTVNGQMYTKENMHTLGDFRDRLRIEVAADNAQLGLPARGRQKTIRSRFRQR